MRDMDAREGWAEGSRREVGAEGKDACRSRGGMEVSRGDRGTLWGRGWGEGGQGAEGKGCGRGAGYPGGVEGVPGGRCRGSTWLISGRRFNIYELFLFESQVFGSSYKELRHPAITW